MVGKVSPMRIGKLDNDELERLVLCKYHRTRKESLSSPTVGEDCAAVDLDGDLTLLSCDPITSASIEQLGRLSVHVNCNDAASAGAEPVGLLVTLLMPPTGSKTQIGRIADDLAEAAQAAQVDILGGHTEVTDCVTRPVTCTTVVARLPRERLLTGPEVGDALVMTKFAAIEGSILLAEDHAERLPQDPALLHTLKSLSKYLSVVAEGRIAMENGAHAMHDVTEGGVLGAAWELAYHAGKGLVINLNAIPILAETALACKSVGVDPLRFIGSGSLLIACRDDATLIAALAQNNIPAKCIGRFTQAGFADQAGNELEPPHADELYKL